MEKLLILIDGSALAYRSYFAFIRNPLINSRGENTSAVFGFTNSLIKLIEQVKPSHIACVFDTPAPTFRHEIYEEYKSTRAKMPDDLADSLPWIEDVVNAFKIPVLKMEGVEADDVIGTLSVKAAETGYEVGMFTGDKDFFQLVKDHVKVLHVKTLDWFDSDAVVKKMGVPPERIIDLLALMGDSSDNVPGVPGVGGKTALKLLGEYGDLDTVLSSADKVNGKKLSESIINNKNLALLSRKLVTIDCNVPIDFDQKALRLEQPDSARLAELFKRFEFGSLYKKYAADPSLLDTQQSTTEIKSSYKLVESVADLKKLLGNAEKAGEIAIDTETTSLDPLEAELVGISFCFQEGEAYYVAVQHEDESANLPLENVLPIMQKFFDTGIDLIGHNLKYDRQVFSNHGVTLKNMAFDTMLAAYVVNPSRRSYKLDYLADDYFGYRMKPITELIGKGAKQVSFARVPVKDASFYAAEDADFTYRLKLKLQQELSENELESLFNEIEMPLMPVLGDMEKSGVAIDTDFLAELSENYGQLMEDHKSKIYEEAGEEFNINSPAQLRVILFDKLNLPSSKKTAKGKEKSTDMDVLAKLAFIHPLPQLILDYRQLSKLKSTYIDALPKLKNARTGRVHTSYNQTVASTGRLSSSDPNLQNIPIRTEQGREIRKAFVAEKGYNILAVDYSQIELRLMAHFAGDQAMIEAFKNHEDIHRRTAAEVNGIKLEDVTDYQRRAAKTANFAIIYGVSAYGLSQQSALSVAESKEYIDTYFNRYPGVKRYMDGIKEFARENGYVETLLKRRRYLPDIKARSRQAREFAERTAINTPIQGTAADLIKLAMIKIAANLEGKKSRMIMQVHDELVFEQYLDEKDYLQKMVKVEMEQALELDVPIEVDLGEGDNWLEAH